MIFSNKPSAAPVEGLADGTEVLSPAEMRERVKAMTSAELARTIEDMNATREMPEVFREREVQEALERRMEEVDVSLETKEHWDALRNNVEARSPSATETEEGFLAKLKEKGGIRYGLGKALLAVLSFLGFKKAVDLKRSLDEKGYLRTAVEGAKEHPVFTAFLAMIGINMGIEAKNYLTQNRDAIETAIRKEAEQTGASVEETTMTLAERTKQAIRNGADMGIRGLVNGLSFAFRGEYDEETGVVTLPFATLRPPVITAYVAGVRRRTTLPTQGLFATFVVEDKLAAIVRQANKATNAAGRAMPYKQELAKKALEHMRNGVAPGAATKESLELERILDTLQDDLDLKETQKIKTNAVEQAQKNPAELRKRVEILEQELAQFDAKQQPKFKETQKDIMERLKSVDSDLKNGNYADVEHRKKQAVDDMKSYVRDYESGATKSKMALGNQLTEALNQLTEAEGAVDVRARQRMDRLAGSGPNSSRLEKVTQFTEKAGCRIARNPLGKLVVKGVAIHSFLPLALEGAAALQMGKEGAAARKAVAIDAAEAGLGFVPGVGEALDFKAAIMGTDLNGRELTTKQRITSGALGALGAASIGLGFFTGGLSIAAFRAFRGSVGAVRATGKLIRGAKVADKIGDGIDVVKAAQKEAEILNTMTKVSKTQKTLIASRKAVDNMQRLVQLGTYADLGVQLYSGVKWVATNTEEFVSDVSNRAVQGVDAIQSFASNHLSPSSHDDAGADLG